MTKPTTKTRATTMQRDEHRCVAGPVGCFGGLEWQHREASGHGGRGVKAPVLVASDGLALCTNHNDAAEGHEQAKALALGHKIRRFRGNPPMPAHEIPYYDVPSRTWFLPSINGTERKAITVDEARERLIKAGNITLERPPLRNLPTELREATLYGFDHELLDADPRPFGAVLSRHAVSLTVGGRQVAVYRATREGEYLGWGWVEHPDGEGRTEFHDWKHMRVALRDLARAKGIG